MFSRFEQVALASMFSRFEQVVLAPGLVDELAGYFSESDDFSDIEHLM